MPWQLWRQDDHGNESLIQVFDDRVEAEETRDAFVARGHRQHYWLIEAEREVSDEREMRLATYGTLAPGRPNHGQLADLPGRWLAGCVRGALLEGGWGAALGFPGLVLDGGGQRVEVDVFESTALGAHWERLDAFEGAGYRRAAVEVETAEGVLPAWIYVVAVPPGTA